MTDETFGMPHSLLYQDECPSEYVYAKSKDVERFVETNGEWHGARAKLALSESSKILRE